jgi:uncharacterized protein YuzE
MQFHYYPETDSLYIQLSEKTSVDSLEIINEKMVLDFDENGRVIGIDVYGHASEILDLPYLESAGVLIKIRPKSSGEDVSHRQSAAAD